MNRDQTHHACYLMVYYMKRFSRLEAEYLVSAALERNSTLIVILKPLLGCFTDSCHGFGCGVRHQSITNASRYLSSTTNPSCFDGQNIFSKPKILVREIVPLLFKHKLELVPGHVRRIRTEDRPLTIVMGRDYFLQLLRGGQSYFANEMDWQGLDYFTTQMLNLCRYFIFSIYLFCRE